MMRDWLFSGLTADFPKIRSFKKMMQEPSHAEANAENGESLSCR